MIVHDLPWALVAAAAFLVVCAVAIWGSVPNPAQVSPLVPFAVRIRALKHQRHRRPR